jgi:hypothetical protein
MVQTDRNTGLLNREAQNVKFSYSITFYLIQGDQKVSVHLMITLQKVTSNFQSVPRQCPDIH